MSKLYKYNELYFALVLIFIYCFINSLGNGIFDLMTLSLNVLLVIVIIYFIKRISTNLCVFVDSCFKAWNKYFEGKVSYEKSSTSQSWMQGKRI